MAEPAASGASSPATGMLQHGCEIGNITNTDVDFDPTPEMLINDYDDERTLDEEEAMEEDDASELDDLQKEGEIPMDQLLAMYGYNSSQPTPQQNQETSSPNPVGEASNSSSDVDDEMAPSRDESNEPHDVPVSRLLRSDDIGASSDEQEEDDSDYEPEVEGYWKKQVQVGIDYQAVVPEGLSAYGDGKVYENDDHLLWDPSQLEDQTVERYVHEIQQYDHSVGEGVYAVPTGTHIKDDEQALYLLSQCSYNIQEALSHHRTQPLAPPDTLSLWSEEECRNFENGLRSYGKDFFQIQQNKVPTRSVGELVQFYYLWKKTERHDTFAARTRVEKKKYTLHPGITDYMDRFLDEQDSASLVDISSAMHIEHCLFATPSTVCTDVVSNSQKVGLTACVTAAGDAPPSLCAPSSHLKDTDPAISSSVTETTGAKDDTAQQLAADTSVKHDNSCISDAENINEFPENNSRLEKHVTSLDSANADESATVSMADGLPSEDNTDNVIATNSDTLGKRDTISETVDQSAGVLETFTEESCVDEKAEIAMHDDVSNVNQLASEPAAISSPVSMDTLPCDDANANTGTCVSTVSNLTVVVDTTESMKASSVLVSEPLGAADIIDKMPDTLSVAETVDDAVSASTVSGDNVKMPIVSDAKTDEVSGSEVDEIVSSDCDAATLMNVAGCHTTDDNVAAAVACDDCVSVPGSSAECDDDDVIASTSETLPYSSSLLPTNCNVLTAVPSETAARVGDSCSRSVTAADSSSTVGLGIDSSLPLTSSSTADALSAHNDCIDVFTSLNKPCSLSDVDDAESTEEHSVTAFSVISSDLHCQS